MDSHLRRLRGSHGRDELTTFPSDGGGRGSGSSGQPCRRQLEAGSYELQLFLPSGGTSPPSDDSHHNVVDQLSGRFWFGQNCQELSGRLCWPVPRHCSHRRVVCKIRLPLHEFEGLLKCPLQKGYFETTLVEAFTEVILKRVRFTQPPQRGSHLMTPRELTTIMS